ncbi:MAG: phenylacetate--CoA ligase family protein [Verrucomicrobiales bacterium]|nr:phenylacetate--CoA ligase family protein [Verrucomicrobiales bacterium]
MAASEPNPARHDARIDRLRDLLRTVVATNSFYQKHWAGTDVVEGWRTLAEFAQRVPVTCKSDLVRDQTAHPPYGSNLTFPLERYTRCHGTSGTSGRPIRWLDTPESWDWMLGNWRCVYRAAGVTRADRVFFAFSFGPFLGFWTAFESALGLGCLCLPGGGMTSVARLRSLLEQRATVLCCTPTYALHLGDVAQQQGIDLSALELRRILVAGEPGGSVPAVRASIQARWPGARVFDHHGMTEVGPVSYECPAQPGVLHVIEDSYVAEVLDSGSAADGTAERTGELVLTTLGRVGSPLVRYRTGDLVRARRGRCPCGTDDLALVGGVLGRTDDMVVVRGVNVFPGAVDDVVREAGGVAEYQAEIVREGSLLALRLVVEPAPGGASGADVARTLEDLFQSRLALRVPVRLVAGGTLPRFEMKARRWVRLDGVGSEAGTAGAA